LALLLGLCAIEGFQATIGLRRPPDIDSLRDVGFIQSFLDGNWFGDPAYAGEWRWYPPLMHAVGAAGVLLTGIPALTLWVQLGPWINLFAPLTFFLMNARLFERRAAAVATAVFVLFNGALAWPHIQASYTPWPLIPSVALPLFFLGIMLVHARGGSTRMVDAVVVGSFLGIVFLAHTVPALLLSVIVAMTAFAEHGIRLRTILWLAVVALLELSWALPFLAPLLLQYRLHIANPVPGAWTDALMHPRGAFVHLGVLNMPGVVAALGAWLLWRRAPLSRRTVVILSTWIAVCIGLLIRHQACTIADTKGAYCEIFVISPHHYHFYLAAAWASLLGHTVWQAARFWSNNINGLSRVRVALLSGIPLAVFALGSFWFLFRPHELGERKIPWWEVEGDVSPETGPYHWIRNSMRPASESLMRKLAQYDRAFDIGMYHWILAHTRPTDLFVSTGGVEVISAGRRQVAMPEVHSNPYVVWASREDRRLRFIAAITDGKPDSGRALCDLIAEAGTNNDAYFLLPNTLAVDSSAVELVLRGDYSSLYRVKTEDCGVG
jgi:hypothetical protein